MLLGLLSLLAPAQAAEVLVLWDVTGGSTPALVAAIEAQGHTVTLSDVSEDAWDGTNPSLDGFQAVVHLNGTTYDEPMVRGAPALLLDFVEERGGGYIHFEWDAYAQSVGHDALLRDLTLFDRSSSRTGAVTMTVTSGQESHPVLDGVTFPYTFYATVNTGPVHAFSSDPSAVLATDDAGYPAIAARELGVGRVVGFHHAGNWNVRNLFNDAGLARLAANAVTWSAGCDDDQDGFVDQACGGDDCNDADADISPDADEIAYDGIDQDCDGEDLCDVDDDGYDAAQGMCRGADCNDDDEDVNPLVEEIWYDGVDQNCDGADDYDQDRDGFRSQAETADGDDCDDTDLDVNPAADEGWYDGIDQDCDGADDYDQDGDGFRSAAESDGDDCDDTDETVNPDAEDVWYDGVDQDCDGADDHDQDGDGFLAASGGGEDCDDTNATVHPGAEELKDGLDNDCDGEAEGCGCATSATPSSAGLMLGLFLLMGLRRRR